MAAIAMKIKERVYIFIFSLVSIVKMQFHEVRRTHIQNCKNKVTERSSMMSTSVPELTIFKVAIFTMETKERGKISDMMISMQLLI